MGCAQEPDLARVKRSQEDMDTDRSGAVSRLEWLRFNVVQRDRDRPGSRQGSACLALLGSSKDTSRPHQRCPMGQE